MEQYIARCARSLFDQTLEDIEFIFVDDCSPDHSVEVLEDILSKYPKRREQVRILHMPENSGQAAVREMGVKAASGDYVIHCDSDDEPLLTMYETMWRQADGSGADVVLCDYYVMEKEKERIVKACPDRLEDPVGALLCGAMGGYSWNKLVRRTLYDSIALSPVADIWEDKVMMVQLLSSCQTWTVVREPLYRYRINPQGICLSSEVRYRIAALQANVSVILRFLEENGLSVRYSGEVSALKAEVQMHALPLSKKEYLALYPENRWKQLFVSCIPSARKMGHLTKLLGIHGISKAFRRT